MTRFSILAFAAAALVPAAALAQTTTAEVRYDDLNLASPAGMARLELRIRSAAREVCRSEALTGSRIVDRREELACIAGVRRQVAQGLVGKGIALARN